MKHKIIKLSGWLRESKIPYDSLTFENQPKIFLDVECTILYDKEEFHTEVD